MMDDTEVVSELTQGLAWSLADTADITPYVKPRPVLPWVVAAAAVAAVTAWYLFPRQNPPAAPAPPTVSAPSPVGQPPEPTPIPSPGTIALETPPAPPPIDRDALYFNLLQTADVHFSTPAAAIYNGHLVCEALDRGDSLQTVIADNVAKSPLVDAVHVGRGVRAAVVAYCPQYEK